MYVPELTKNLLSVPAITQSNAEVRFDKEKCIIVRGDKECTIGHCISGKLFRVGVGNPVTDSAFYVSQKTVPNKEIWHCRFGHLNIQDINHLQNSGMVNGLNCDSTKLENKCEGCIFGKMTKIPLPKQATRRATKILEMVHTDLCGPMQVPSHGGSRYVLTFTDDFSRYTTVYFLHSKSDTLDKFKDYVKLMENATGNKIMKLSIKSLRSDNGGEFTSTEFDIFCNKMGISREFSNAYCPAQNGVAERFNRTMIESARSMIYHARLPIEFWAEAVNTAVYIRNRSPTTALKNKTPFECWFNHKPDVSNLRVFGSLCYIHIPDQKRQKLDAKSYKGIFVGYPEGL